MAKHILYYVVSSVHMTYMRRIAENMPHYEFRMIFEEAESWWTQEAHLSQFPYQKYVIRRGEIPKTLDDDPPALIVFSTVQPREAPIKLLAWALEKNIPTVAIQEANQIALNNGITNNYLLPLDCVFVASQYEKDGLIAAGVAASRIRVSGWPFFDLQDLDTTEREALKSKLSLPLNQPIVSLTLTGLLDAGETADERRKQLEIAANGLPDDYCLVIKPHPKEPISSLKSYVDAYATRALIVDGAVAINDLLSVTDILLNRGVSQVALEALVRQIPVIVISTGIKTAFHDLVPDVIVENPQDLRRAISGLDLQVRSLEKFEKFFQVHLPYCAPDALAQTCQGLEDVLQQREDQQILDYERWLDLVLYQAWRIDRQQALAWLQAWCVVSIPEMAQALQKLILYQASRTDLDLLKSHFKAGFRFDVLKCLWIDLLWQKNITLETSDLVFVKDFPPTIHSPLFFNHCELWGKLLHQSKLQKACDFFIADFERRFGDDPRALDVIENLRLYFAGYWGRFCLRLKNVWELLESYKLAAAYKIRKYR